MFSPSYWEFLGILYDYNVNPRIHLYGVGAAYNILYSKKNDNFGLYSGISVYYDRQEEYIVDENDAFYKHTYQGVGVYADFTLRYKKVSLNYAYSLMATTSGDVNHYDFKGNMYGISFYIPLSSKKNKPQDVTFAHNESKNGWNLCLDVNMMPVIMKENKHYYYFRADRYLDEVSYMTRLTLDFGIGIMYEKQRWLFQFSAKGPLVYRTNLSMVYNINPWFAPGSSRFIGVELGVHYLYVPYFFSGFYFDRFQVFKKADIHYGLLFKGKKNWYFGITSYAILDRTLEIDRYDVETISSMIQFKFGKFFRLSGEKK
jgi:hypothetical protein